ncbi:hypothetical protein F3J45_25500 [Pantoea sp. Ap-967]|nr:hypothetical protein [Pantoea sp. Ap-967]
MRSSAARAAHRRQACSYISSENQQGGRARWRRRNWPETDVGAGLPAMRRAGGARSTPQQTPQPLHPGRGVKS